jgi:hypothetical protein
MPALMETIVEIAHPAEAALEVARLNAELAHRPTIPREVADGVREISEGVTQTALARWETIDPHLTLIVHRGVIAAQHALEEPADIAARDSLRVALESIRQGFAAIAETEPIGDERSPKEIVQWLAATTGASQAALADLLGVSLRHFQRWVSPQSSTQPEGEDARKLRAVARIVNQLRFALTPAGAIAWFDWPRAELRGKTPRRLLDDPARLPELVAIAGSMRSTHAA